MKISFGSTGPTATTHVFIEPKILWKSELWLSERTTPSIVIIVTDSNVGPLYGTVLQTTIREAGLRSEVFTIAAGEPSKTFRTATDIFAFLGQQNFGRDGLIIAMGGGVVGDLAGFVAGTWMRGVPWIYCPTTMEADVDACLGGKTAVNLSSGKNLVGVFHHPIAVAIDPGCLGTLPDRDVRAGLAEAVKHALLQSSSELDWLEAGVQKILALDADVITELIERNLRFKGQIVSEDPYEQHGRRIVLNFGHTIGHAIETLFEGALRHGECVALGMLAACRISHRAGLLGGDDVERLRRLLQALSLPIRLDTALDVEKVLGAIRLDKKNTAGKSRFVLLEGIGNPVIRDDIPTLWIAEAFDSLLTA